ncbi:MAG: hypothetical protein AMS27_16810 [Bacteroides sp. SM23_62_1]|nr:MAG: hypothetical protein AMS27_16810 [Bacteroides sp. SM23_62_1]
MDYTELFDKYIDGRLKDRELAEFERALENDPGLKKELEKFLELHNAAEKDIGQDKIPEEEYEIDRETDKLSKNDIYEYRKEKRESSDSDMSDFEHLLKDAEKDYFNKGGRKIKITRLVWYAAAAMVFIVLTISVFILVRNNQQKSVDLYAFFFEPYIKSEKIFEITRSSDDFYYAIQVFEAGDYARASILFNNLADSVELKVYALFYAGLTSIELGRWEEAIELFKSAIGCGENQMTYNSRWYLGLCYLRIDDEESGKIQFKILASEKNEYSRNARQILRILDRRR